MSIARHHSEWLSLVEVSGPFLSIPVLMRVFPQGLENHDPEKFRTMRLAYEEWEENNQKGSRTNPSIHGAWVRFVLTAILGLPDEAILEQQAIPQMLQASVAEHAEFLRPSLVIAEPGTAKPRMLVQTYPASQDLDEPVNGKSWNASPGTRMMELCHATAVRLGLVTNGEQWMLVDAPKNETTGFASWYANIWLEESITFRAFTSLLGAERFFSAAPADTLEALLKESAGNQQEVTDQLGYQVRRAVEVLIQSLDRADQDHDRSLLASISEPQLYEAALTVMMRLVFLFSAEERGLLLLNDELYARNYAVSTLREQLRKTADDHGEEILERRHDAWCRLLSTFRVVYGGVKHDRMTLPAYGGHLFDPDRFPFLEGRKKGTTWITCEADPLPVNNRTVLHSLEALQVLQVVMPGGEKVARRVSFRALDIEQIGHVYEGLLDHTAKRASEPMLGLIGTRDREPEVPLSKLEELKASDDGKLIEFLRGETGKSANALKAALKEEIDLHNANRFQAVSGSDKALLKRIAPFAGLVRDDTFGYPVVIPTGSVFVTAGTDRRSSGTHYTPSSLTEPIVRYTLEPLVYVGPAEGKPKDEWQLRTPKELLDLKICDMACGSGAFLVQACRYLAERLVEAWEVVGQRHPGLPTIAPEGVASEGFIGEGLLGKDAEERLANARRIVAQRCLYGVDINPLAAEMAKLSLWILTVAKDRPFSFLDHAITGGDSLTGIAESSFEGGDPLVGLTSLKQLEAFSLDVSETGSSIFLAFLPGELEAVKGLRRHIADIPVRSVEDVQEQERCLADYKQRLARLKCVADLLVASYMSGRTSSERKAARDEAAIQVAVHFRDRPFSQFRDLADRALGTLRPFHWPLEFIDVFLDRGGFDGIVGNPPFMGGQKITGALGTAYRDYLVERLAGGQRGSADLCAYFFLRASQLLQRGGYFGLVATNTIAQGDTREVGLDQITQRGCMLIRAVASRKWPGTANLEVSHVWGRKGDWMGESVLDDHVTSGITSFLTAPGTFSGEPYRLKANDGRSFQGSIVLGMGFVLGLEEADALLGKDSRNKDVLFPYLNGEDLNSRPDLSPSRRVINFFDWPIEKAMSYRDCFRVVEEKVKPERLENKRKERREKWWQYAERCPALYRTIAGLNRVLVCPVFTKWLSFAWVPNGMVYMNKLYVFALQDNSDFAVLQSHIHEWWAREYSGTLETRLQYAPTDCFETFPFPRERFGLDVIGEQYDSCRQTIMQVRQEGLTKIYNRFHNPSEAANDIQKLRELHEEMDKAAAAAYGWDELILGHGFHATKQGLRFTISEPARREVLARLLKLNHERYAEEVSQGLHEGKKKSSRSRATPTAVAEMPDSGLFAGLAYPATDTDRAICAAALAVVEQRNGIHSVDHLDAILLTAHMDWCEVFLSAADSKSLKRVAKSAPNSLFVSNSTPVNWKQGRDYLEQREAISVDRASPGHPLREGKLAASVRATLPAGTEKVVALALKALEALKALKHDVAGASEAQKRFIMAIQKEERAMALVA